MSEPFWIHPSVKADTSAEDFDEVPFNEKKWARYADVQIAAAKDITFANGLDD